MNLSDGLDVVIRQGRVVLCRCGVLVLEMREAILKRLC